MFVKASDQSRQTRPTENRAVNKPTTNKLRLQCSLFYHGSCVPRPAAKRENLCSCSLCWFDAVQTTVSWDQGHVALPMTFQNITVWVLQGHVISACFNPGPYTHVHFMTVIRNLFFWSTHRIKCRWCQDRSPVLKLTYNSLKRSGTNFGSKDLFLPEPLLYIPHIFVMHCQQTHISLSAKKVISGDVRYF